MLAYNLATNRAEWIPMQGSGGDLSPAEEASVRELSNIVLHDPSEVPQRMDHFQEQRGESGAEEAVQHSSVGPRRRSSVTDKSEGEEQPTQPASP